MLSFVVMTCDCNSLLTGREASQIACDCDSVDRTPNIIPSFMFGDMDADNVADEVGCVPECSMGEIKVTISLTTSGCGADTGWSSVGMCISIFLGCFAHCK